MRKSNRRTCSCLCTPCVCLGLCTASRSMTARQFCKYTQPKQLFFLVEWDEGSHSIVCGKDLDRESSTVKPADALRVKVSVGSKTEWYKARVIGAGDKNEMLALQDQIEDGDGSTSNTPSRINESENQDEQSHVLCSTIPPTSCSTPRKRATSSRDGISSPKKAKRMTGKDTNRKGWKGKATPRQREKAKTHAAQEVSMEILNATECSPVEPTSVDEHIDSPDSPPPVQSSSDSQPVYSSPCTPASPPFEKESVDLPPVGTPVCTFTPSPVNSTVYDSVHYPVKPTSTVWSKFSTPTSLSPFNDPRVTQQPFRTNQMHNYPQYHPNYNNYGYIPSNTPKLFQLPSDLPYRSRDTTPLSDVSDSQKYQELLDMLGGLQRQLCVGMNSLHEQINTISEDFSSFKCEIFKKRSSVRKTVSCPGPSPSSTSLSGSDICKESDEIGGAGCWFGEYKSESNDVKMWVPGITEAALRGVDCQLRCKDLCRKLVELVFTEEELRQGNATEARTAGVSLLDQSRLYAIRVHCLYRFPTENGEQLSLNDVAEKERWKKLKQTIVNVVCREARAKWRNQQNI